ncbi:hypothetical protein HMPREF2993_10405 [Corynebacterium sp. HMSC068G04]|nr:hypothetical protein HMPREF2993_10405 [Corynebacterium sp. HMSC068G04]
MVRNLADEFLLSGFAKDVRGEHVIPSITQHPCLFHVGAAIRTAEYDDGAWSCRRRTCLGRLLFLSGGQWSEVEALHVAAVNSLNSFLFEDAIIATCWWHGGVVGLQCALNSPAC